MTLASTIHSTSVEGGLPASPMEVLLRIRHWLRIRRDRRRLMELPDHILRDVGIARPEIDSLLLYGRVGRTSENLAGRRRA